MKGFLMVVLIIISVAVGPMVLIWAINGLFGLSIAITLKTWFCALLIAAALRG